MDDLISRQAAIDTEGLDEEIRCEMCRNPMHTDRGCDGGCTYDEKLYKRIMQILDERIKPLPSAQPEITRCKGCKHQVKEWRTDKRLKDKGYMVCGCEVVGDACGYWALLGQDDDYCSFAERRTDE